MGSEIPATEDLFALFVAQLSKAQDLPLYATIKSLRDSYPDHVVSKIDKASIDLLAYAADGQAEATPSSETDYITNLSYTRETSGTARLVKDDVLFGAYQYTWKNTTFLLFVILPEDSRDRSEHHFLLTPRDAGYRGGVHPKTKELVEAAGQWTAANTTKTLDYNSENWGPRVYSDDAEDMTLRTMPSLSWDDIIMDAAAKTSLREYATSFFTSRDFFKKFNLPWKRGVIFHGPSGTGKTAIMKTLMATLAKEKGLVPSVYVKFTDRHDIYPSTIHGIFSRARLMAPCILVLEDLDCFMTEESRETFLEEVDCGNNDGILILGSTRNINELDPAIRDRPSRFDTKYAFNLPGDDERVAFAKQWKTKLGEGQSLELSDEAWDFVAKITVGFNYAYLKEIFNALLYFPQNDFATEEKESKLLSSRPQAQADIATPETLRENRVVKFIRQQVSILLNEIETSDAAAKKTCRLHSRGRFVRREEACPGCTADENEDSEVTSTGSYSRIEFNVSSPGPSSVQVLDNQDDACPGCDRRLVAQAAATDDACPGCDKSVDSSDMKALESSDPCPGCDRKSASAMKLASNDTVISDDACPGCDRKKAEAAAKMVNQQADGASPKACPGCDSTTDDAMKLTSEDTVDPDKACPGCDRKKTADTTSKDDTLAAMDACPGCDRKKMEAATKLVSGQTDDVSPDACPGCDSTTAGAVSLASGDGLVSDDACPGCDRKKTSDVAPSSESNTNASTDDACPGCDRKKAVGTANLSTAGKDVSPDACPGCDAAESNKEPSAVSTDVSTTAKEKETEKNDNASTDDACPGCDRKKATNAASVGAQKTAVSPDACPGCDSDNLSKETTSASADVPSTETETEAAEDDAASADEACPGCDSTEAGSKVSQGNEQDDVSTDACPGCD